MTLYKIAIVGTGGAGLLALLLLLKSKQCKASEIVLIDPYHDGGDLQRKWWHVTSNTRWGQMLSITESLGYPRDSLPDPWKALDPNLPTQLQHYIQLLRWIIKSNGNDCECIVGHCSDIEEFSQGVRLSIRMPTGAHDTVEAKACLVCTGAEAKRDSFPIPVLPLEVALNRDLLRGYASPASKVVLVGTAHSGTLVMKNLNDLNVEHAVFYRGSAPFSFARDGHYDGIKQESEAIADAVLNGQYTQTHLFPLTNTAQLLRWSRKADWIVYAIGFERRPLGTIKEYDGKTGKCHGFTRVWGFGIGYPNQAPDGQHWDVSLPSFFAHIQQQIPQIVESFYV
jgi:hypothetical protein